MTGLVLVGLGLDSERGISVEGLDEARRADRVFAELYTSLMPNLSLPSLEKMLGKTIRVLTRREMEEENATEILDSSQKQTVVLLVPGDPMIATTHVSIRLALAKRKIPSRIIHAASVVSAISGATGLQNFKFGKSITLPKSDPVPASVLDTLRENRRRGLHTLLLLDVETDRANQMTVQEALAKLFQVDPSIGDWLAVGAARIGSSDEKVRAAKVKTLARDDLGKAPHCIVFPGKLHFMEEEALRVFSGATTEDLEGRL